MSRTLETYAESLEASPKMRPKPGAVCQRISGSALLCGLLTIRYVSY
jgi:hypothetical protein